MKTTVNQKVCSLQKMFSSLESYLYERLLLRVKFCLVQGEEEEDGEVGGDCSVRGQPRHNLQTPADSLPLRVLKYKVDKLCSPIGPDPLRYSDLIDGISTRSMP